MVCLSVISAHSTQNRTAISNTKSFYNRRSKLRTKKPPESSFIAAKPAASEFVSLPELLQLKHGQSTVLLPSNTDVLWLAALLRALS